MREILIVANTFYQLIVAIQLKLTLFSSDNVTLLLSNHSNNAQLIIGRIEKEGLFSEAILISTKGVRQSRSIPKRMADLYRIAHGKNNRFFEYVKQIKKNPSYYFDELISFNISMDIYGIFSCLVEYNPKIIVSMYEEGLLSYNLFPEPSKGQIVVNDIRQLLGKKRIIDSFKHFYCFYPELYKGTFTAVKIPVLTKDCLCSHYLSKVFEPKHETHDYNEKYIFFSSVYDFEGGEPIGEYELVEKVANLVGKENVLIKTHPRDTRTIYKDHGFKVDCNSEVPWEAIQLSRDFSDKVFLTVNSGSVLAGSLLSDRPTKTYFLFRLCEIKHNRTANKNAEDIETLLIDSEMHETLKEIYIANVIEDIIR